MTSGLAEFVEAHPGFQSPQTLGGTGHQTAGGGYNPNCGGKPLGDFTFEPVRTFLHHVTAALVKTIDVDGAAPSTLVPDPTFLQLGSNARDVKQNTHFNHVISVGRDSC